MTRQRPGVQTPLWVLAIVASIFLLRSASSLLIPIIVAVLISYALDPIVTWMARYRIPRTLAATLLMLLIVGGAGWGVYSLQDNAKEAVKGLPEAAVRARRFLAKSQETTPARELRQTVEVLNGGAEPGHPADAAQSRGAQSAPSVDRRVPSGAEPAAPSDSTADASPTSAIASWLQRALGSSMALAGNATVVGFLTLFLLIASGHFRTRAIEVAGADPERRRVMAKVVDDINTQIQRYLLVQLATASLVAVVTWGVLAWMGISQALVWGILAGLLNAIPYFGPVIVSGGLFAVALVQTGEPVRAIEVSAAALAITSLEGWLLTPTLLGRTERMHALVIFVGLLFFSWLWGAWGTLLAVPMLVVIKSVADHVERLKPLSRLMAP
jgi:predicted PurR-regulated permease PerM